MVSDVLAFNPRIGRALCIVVFIAMAAALAYCAWIGVSNFSRIHV